MDDTPGYDEYYCAKCAETGLQRVRVRAEDEDEDPEDQEDADYEYKCNFCVDRDAKSQ